MKIAILSNSGFSETRKALSFEQFNRLTREGTPSASPIGLASAYGASIWAYRAAQLRADAVSSLPVRVLDRSGEPLERHPLLDLFSDTQSELLKRTELALCIWGEAFLEITRPLFGNLRGLNWLNSQAVTVLSGISGIESYQYLPQYGGSSLTFSPEDVVHLRTFNPNDDLRGLAPLSVALTAVGVERNLTRHAQAFFGNGAVISGIVNIPGATDGMIDTVEAKWKKVMRGVGNFFKTLFLGAEGIEYTPVGAPPRDLAMPELSAEMRRDICAAFGVPPILIGAWEAANYATAEEQRRSFYTETILPEIDFIEDELNRQFVRQFWPDVRLSFDTTDVKALREDEMQRNQAITLAYQGGWMQLNEARARAELPPIEGGDMLYTPQQFVLGMPQQTKAVSGGGGDPHPFRGWEAYP